MYSASFLRASTHRTTGPYRPSVWYFEVVDMFRRFLILGLPKLLRAMAPNAGIQIYIGLVIMMVSPGE